MMESGMILIEDNFDNIFVESKKEGTVQKTLLKGTLMEWGIRNRNKRIYNESDMRLAIDQVNESARKGKHVLGELDHPKTLEVKLENVSHRIMNLEMNGNQVNGVIEVLDKHPKGAILNALIDSGVQVGFSSRGGGSLNESTGEVNGFKFVTIDAVATPSCRSAYPMTIREQLEFFNGDELEKLAEAKLYDSTAQKYFEKEMIKFIQNLSAK